MSGASEAFKALLLANPAVLAAVGPRGVAMHEIASGVPLPYIIFTASAEPQQSLGGPQEDITTFSCGCWAAKADAAQTLADLVVQAVAAHDAASTAESVTYISRSSVFDEDAQLDGVLLSIEWWP